MLKQMLKYLIKLFKIKRFNLILQIFVNIYLKLDNYNLKYQIKQLKFIQIIMYNNAKIILVLQYVH